MAAINKELTIEIPASNRLVEATLLEMRRQAELPPGNDRIIGSFYQAMTLDPRNHTEIKSILQDVAGSRPSMTAEYLTNLLFRTFQYAEIQIVGNSSYPTGLDNPESWETEIEKIMAENKDKVREILLTKDTTTTIYQRYAGPRSILGAKFSGKTINYADFCCGGGYGPLGIVQKEPFGAIHDETPGEAVAKFLNQPLEINQAWGVDKDNPMDPAALPWRRACQVYPSEFQMLPEISAMEEAMYAKDRVKFVQADVTRNSLDHGTIPDHSCDAVSIVTGLYQNQTAVEQKAVFANAVALLKPDGLVIVQDFARKSESGDKLLDFAVSWPEKFSYRTFVHDPKSPEEILEVLQWGNGRCKEVRAGADFDKFLEKIRS